MFISVLELFKIGIGPSSSHTVGPMLAAKDFIGRVAGYLSTQKASDLYLRCTLKGSLAYTGKGHATDRAVALGLHGCSPEDLAGRDVDALVKEVWKKTSIAAGQTAAIRFSPKEHIVFDYGEPLAEHPNAMILDLVEQPDAVRLSETYFSIGGGFITTRSEFGQPAAPAVDKPGDAFPYPFDSARAMLKMAKDNKMTIADMKRANEHQYQPADALDQGLDAIWRAMRDCVQQGLAAQGVLPGGLNLSRRARHLHEQLLAEPEKASLNDWLCAYAMAVCEENAAGHMVVTAPTNGAAGVIPAVLYYVMTHENGTEEDVHTFLLTAGAIGGIIKYRGSISGAEVGCQGEVGTAASMAAAGLCAVHGGTPEQIENAAEIALEHHLGMTCDPVNGLVQVPCIERNGFGAIKAYAAASLAIRGSGYHFMPLDNCIAAMKQTGLEMSHKFKETSLGGLAVSIIEC